MQSLNKFTLLLSRACRQFPFPLFIALNALGATQSQTPCGGYTPSLDFIISFPLSPRGRLRTKHLPSLSVGSRSPFRPLHPPTPVLVSIRSFGLSLISQFFPFLFHLYFYNHFRSSSPARLRLPVYLRYPRRGTDDSGTVLGIESAH